MKRTVPLNTHVRGASQDRAARADDRGDPVVGVTQGGGSHVVDVGHGCQRAQQCIERSRRQPREAGEEPLAATPPAACCSIQNFV